MEQASTVCRPVCFVALIPYYPLYVKTKSFTNCFVTYRQALIKPCQTVRKWSVTTVKWLVIKRIDGLNLVLSHFKSHSIDPKQNYESGKMLSPHNSTKPGQSLDSFMSGSFREVNERSESKEPWDLLFRSVMVCHLDTDVKHCVMTHLDGWTPHTKMKGLNWVETKETFLKWLQN